jgi:hypothetical protein
MWYHYCDKNNHNRAAYRKIAKFKQQKKALFEAKSGPRKKSLDFLSKKLIHSKVICNQTMKRLQAARRGKLHPFSTKMTNQLNY